MDSAACETCGCGRPPSYPQPVPEPQLVRRNPRSNLPVSDTAALLLRAAYDGDIPQVKTLAKRLRKAGKSVEEAAAEIKASWYKRHGPLHQAAFTGMLQMCKFLMKDLRVKVDAPGDDGVTPLFYAIYGSTSTAVVKLLLDHGADPNTTASDGTTPLLHATYRGSCEIVELLLSRRANVDPVSKYGTPLYIAAKDGNTSMLKLLLRHQADPNKVVRLEHTLQKAAMCVHRLEGADLPIKGGPDVNAGTVTPLIGAAKAGSTECIQCLLKAGADANIPDDNGRMPIEIAAIQGWHECVEILFPGTTPLARVAEWSTGGIIEHAKHSSSKTQDHQLQERNGSDFEAQGDDAFRERDYAHALTLYTMAVESNPDDSTLYAKRSLCLLQTGDKGKALDDAETYKDMEPNLSKSCYAQGAALILVKEYGRAIEALMSGLNLDFGSKLIEKALSGNHR